MAKIHKIYCGYNWHSKNKCLGKGTFPHHCTKSFEISDEAYMKHYNSGNLEKALNIQCGKHKCRCGERCIGWVINKPHKLL